MGRHIDNKFPARSVVHTCCPKTVELEEEEELKVILGYFEGWKAAWATGDAVSKDNNNNSDSPLLTVGQLSSIPPKSFLYIFSSLT